MTTSKPGPANLITDVDGIAVGHAHDNSVCTGVTVIVPRERAVASVDVRGGGPGTRETDALAPENLVDAVDAIVLSGGSSYGLAAASAVVKKLGAAGRGYQLGGGPSVSPVVPAAILFDLGNGGDKDWGMEPPYDALGAEAYDAVTSEAFKLGNMGAGFGATAGTLKGGLGSASVATQSGIQIGALVAVNSFGSVLIPGTDCFWAWPFERDNEFGACRPNNKTIDQSFGAGTKAEARAPKHNTTIGVVATNATLSPADAKRVAMMAQDGLARAIRPAHTLLDGDSLFVLATGQVALPDPAPFSLSEVGALAADCVARAIARGGLRSRKLALACRI